MSSAEIAQDMGQQLPATRNLHETLSRAEEWAARRKHTIVGLDHLLLAMAQDPDAVAILLACNVDVEALCMDLLRKLGPEARILSPNAVPPTQDLTVQNLIAHASAAAIAAGQTEIDGANILSAIISGEGGMITHKILEKHGLTFDEALKKLDPGQKQLNDTKTPEQNEVEQPVVKVSPQRPTKEEAATKIPGVNPAIQSNPPQTGDIYQDTIIQAEARPEDYDLSANGADAHPMPPKPELRLDVKPAGRPNERRKNADHSVKQPDQSQQKEIAHQQGVSKIEALKSQVAGNIKSDHKVRAEATDQDTLKAKNYDKGQDQAPPMPPEMPRTPLDKNKIMSPELREQRRTETGEGQGQLSQQPQNYNPTLNPADPPSLQGNPAVRQPQHKQANLEGETIQQQRGLKPDAQNIPATPEAHIPGAPMGQPGLQPMQKAGQPPMHPVGQPMGQPDQQRVLNELGAKIKHTGQEFINRPPEDQVVEYFPKVMRMGKVHYVEVRVARFANTELDFNPDNYGLRAKDDKTPITKAITVRLTGADSQFLIDCATSSTQWTEIHKGLVDEADFTVWRWRVLPRSSGNFKLRLDITARTSTDDGMSAEVPLQPSKTIDVKVTRHYLNILKKLLIITVIFGIGFGIAKYGEQILEKAKVTYQTMISEEDL